MPATGGVENRDGVADVEVLLCRRVAVEQRLPVRRDLADDAEATQLGVAVGGKGCSAVSVGSKLNDWKTKPSRSRRNLVNARSPNVVISVPTPARSNNWMDPDVASATPATQCSNVDLPDPDGPMMAVNACRSNATLTLSRARTAASPCHRPCRHR